MSLIAFVTKRFHMGDIIKLKPPGVANTSYRGLVWFGLLVLVLSRVVIVIRGLELDKPETQTANRSNLK